MKSIIVAFAVILLIIAMPFVFQSIEDARTNEAELTFASVTTSGVSTANVTLNQAIYRGSVNSVTAVSSNITSDTPSAYSFNSVSRVLQVNGLAEDETRTLSVAFNIENENLDDGSLVFFSLFRWFYIFMIVGMSGGAIYSFFD